MRIGPRVLEHPRPGGAKWQKRLADNGLSLDLVSVLGECFEDDPQDRIPDAGALAARLAKSLPSAEPKKPEPLVLTPPPPPPPKLQFPEPVRVEPVIVQETSVAEFQRADGTVGFTHRAAHVDDNPIRPA